ncbi:MAG: preprotein translocase subunit SecE [Microgenomates group bacterium]|jgi:preprotein translocase subunit SecE
MLAMAQNQEAAVRATMFDGLLSELKKVSWPTRKETIRLTVIVLLISLIIGAYVGIIDILLAKVLEILTKTTK